MKKWKTGRIWTLVTAMVLLAALSLSACGSKSYNTAAMAETTAAAAYVMDALWIPPGFLIVVLVVAINFVGDALRDALDPSAVLNLGGAEPDAKIE